MEVDRSDMTFPKQVVLHLDRPGICLALSLVLRDQTTILGLQTNDSVHRFAVSDENGAQATENSCLMRYSFRPVLLLAVVRSNAMRALTDSLNSCKTPSPCTPLPKEYR